MPSHLKLVFLTTFLTFLSTYVSASTCSISSAKAPTDPDANCDSDCQTFVYNAAGSASAVPALSNTPSSDESPISDCASGNACVMLSAIYFICLNTKTYDWTDGYGGTGNLKTGKYEFKNGQSTSVAIVTNTQAVFTMAASSTPTSSSSTAGAGQVVVGDMRSEQGFIALVGMGLAVLEWLLL